MTLQNRVCPMGALHADPGRGKLTGNRGILHGADRSIRRNHAHKAWITCRLGYKGRRRRIMAPRRYTELFFLDEATALAAGHRPCGECRRADYDRFTALWQQVFGPPGPGQTLSRCIDQQLHAARIGRDGVKVTCTHDAKHLPDGALIVSDNLPWLILGSTARPWQFAGYGAKRPRPQGPCTVLTPAPTLAVLARGYTPMLHDSARQQ